MKKIAFAVPALAAVGSAFAAEGDMTTYADPSAAITAIGTVASSESNPPSTEFFYDYLAIQDSSPESR